MKDVIIITPIYRQLNNFEKIAFSHNSKVLSDYDQCLLTPQGFDANEILQTNPKLIHKEVTTDWLGQKNGIMGYNDMMTSAEFYRMFLDYEYILICHVDAWIFRHKDLGSWLKRGYDCVAAPWFVRNPWLYKLLGQTDITTSRGRHYLLHGKVGNGGLSLRKTQSFLDICLSKQNDIYHAIHINNMPEDTFFALQAELKFPKANEALEFAFDTKPDYCYKKKKQLPFGCHKWFDPLYLKFWKKFIPLTQNI